MVQAFDFSNRGEPEEKKAPKTTMLEALRLAAGTSAQLGELGIPPVELVLGDWFKQGDCGFIFGTRGLGKSWLGLAMATAIATGRQLGTWQAAKARKCLYMGKWLSTDSAKE